ncbi:hypothetical protein ACFPH6_33085 [Streptomyces xiangluensis]|uniref:DUF3618 domain-containing protein n=1 Tax=Streptomyces xiangluensis TaxID=2665720 RepID=A0ABV8YYV0_9ACTN
MTMTPQELQDQEQTLELINSELAARLARQSESGAKVDTKAIFLVGFAATPLSLPELRAVHRRRSFTAYAVAIGFGIAVFNWGSARRHLGQCQHQAQRCSEPRIRNTH